MEKNEKKRFKLIVDILMIVILFAFLICGLVKTIFFAEEINYIENRKANKMQDIGGIKEFISGDLQDNMELAFSDQMLFSDTMKNKYNFIKNKLIGKFQDEFFEQRLKGRYADVGNNICKILGYDYLLFRNVDLKTIEPLLDIRIQDINSVTTKMKDTEFLLYYVEKDADINFETNEKSGIFEYIDDNINKDNLKTKKFEINSFDEYREYFYKIDHHWNYKGSYKAYCQIMKDVFKEEPLKPRETVVFDKGHFLGSKTRMSGTDSIYTEIFEAYCFDLPSHSTYLNGTSKKYGHIDGDMNEALNSNAYDLSYGVFYGGDVAEIEFDYKNPQKNNILFIGESYDNAILELIASHFNKTYSIDLRHYEREFGKKFSIEEYVKEKDIDTVVLIGNMDYYTGTGFNIGEK